VPLVGTKANAGASGLGFLSSIPGEELGGLVLMTPTSVDKTGTSATITTNGAVEFTACSSISLNGVFTSEYDNYKIVVRATCASQVSLQLRWRASGSDASGTNYTTQLVYVTPSSVAASRDIRNYHYLGYVSAAGYLGVTVDTYGPQIAASTHLRTISIMPYPGPEIWDEMETHSLATSYDGVTIYSSANWTGQIAVYGMND